MNFEDLKFKAETEGRKRISVGAFVTDERGLLLIVKRVMTDTLGGFFEIPGGSVEVGERIPDALKREVFEETGLTLWEISRFVNSFDYERRDGTLCRRLNFFVKATGREVKLSEEHDSFHWAQAPILPMKSEMQRCICDFLDSLKEAE